MANSKVNSVNVTKGVYGIEGFKTYSLKRIGLINSNGNNSNSIYLPVRLREMQNDQK